MAPRVGMLLLLTLFWWPRAQAEDRPRVAVIVAGPAAQKQVLESALLGQRGWAVALRIESLPNEADEAPVRAPVGLQEALGRARAHYVDAEFEACVAELPEPAELVELLGSGDLSSTARALMWRMGCEFGRGQSAEARRLAAQFALWRLDVPPDVGALAPDAEQLLTQALLARDKRAPVAVELACQPAAMAAVDGRELHCTTPCTVQLLPGAHVLSLHVDGAVPLVAPLQVGMKPSRVVHTLTGASPALARRQWRASYGDRLELDSVGSLKLLSSALPARKLLLLQVAAQAGRLFELRGAYTMEGRLVARDRQPAVPAERLADDALQLSKDLLVRGDTLPPPRPVWKSPWLWTAVAGATLAAVLTTALLLRKPEQRTEVSFE